MGFLLGTYFIDQKMNYCYFRLAKLFSCSGFEKMLRQSFSNHFSRYLNHSCSPNLLMHPVRVGCPVPKLALFAKRDIEPGEELTFDYGDVGEREGKEEEKGIDVTHRKECLCGAKQCRGYLPYNPS